MLVLSSILLVLAVIIGLFIGCVHPLLGIIDCALSKRSVRGKVMWIVATLLFGPLASLTYAFAGGSSNWLRRTSWYSVQLGIGGLLLSMLLLFRSPEEATQAELSVEDEVSVLAEVTESDSASAFSSSTSIEEPSADASKRFVSTPVESEPLMVTDDLASSVPPAESNPFQGEQVAENEMTVEWQSDDFAEPSTTSIAEGMPAVGQWFNWLQQAVPQTTVKAEGPAESRVEASLTQTPANTRQAPSKTSIDGLPANSEPRNTASVTNLSSSEPQTTKTREQKRAFNRYTNSFEQLDAPTAPTRRPVINRYLEQ